MKFNKLLLSFSNKIIYLLSIIIIGFLTFDSFFHTSYMSYDYAEKTIFYNDNVLLSIFSIFLFLFIVILFKKKIKKINYNKLSKILLFAFFVFSIIWVLMANSQPRADSEKVYSAAKMFFNGNYIALTVDKYLYYYPFQLGLVFIDECLYWLFRDNTIIVFQLLNCISITLCYIALVKIVDKLFKNKENNLLCTIFLVLFLSSMIYCSFMYGNLISFSLSIISLYYFILFMEKGKNLNKRILYLILSIMLISISYFIKSTSLIVVVALIIINILYFIKKKDIFNIIYILLLVLCFNLPLKIIFNYYESASDIKINDGIPKIGWVVMGLSDGPIGYGWYNHWTVDTYRKLNFNSDSFKEEAYNNIDDITDNFKKNPNLAIDFFYKKISSEWNNPTYQSVWILDNTSDNVIVNSLVYGKLNKLFYIYSNYLQLIIYMGCFSFLLFYRKFDFIEMSMLLIVIGGFIFYIFWEAKSQYVFQYFVLLIPYASIGWNRLGDKIINKCLLMKKRCKL